MQSIIRTILLSITLFSVFSSRAQEEKKDNLLNIMPIELGLGPYVLGAVNDVEINYPGLGIGAAIRYNFHLKSGIRLWAQYYLSKSKTQVFNAITDSSGFGVPESIDVESKSRLGFFSFNFDFIRYLGVGDVEEGRLYVNVGMGYSLGKMAITNTYFPVNGYPVEWYQHGYPLFRNPPGIINQVTLRLGLSWEFQWNEKFICINYDTSVPINGYLSEIPDNRVLVFYYGLNLGIRFYADQL